MSPAPALGLVGCGAWGKLILRDLVALGARVVVATPGEAARAEALGRGARGAVASLDQLPAGLDGFVVATPASTHYRVVDALLPRGLPIFTEKPMACDAGEAADLARRGGGLVFVMEKWRYHGGIEALARLAAERTLGEPLGISTRRLQWGCPHPDVDPVWTLAPHDLSIVDHVLGTLPAVRGARGLARGEGLEAISAWFGDRPWAEIQVSARHPGRERRVALACAGGTAVLADPMADHLLLYRGAAPGAEAPAPEPECLPVDPTLPLYAELAHFCAFLGGGPAPRCDAARGARLVEALVRIRALAAAPGGP